MAINQLSTANTFEQWLIATQSLIAFANSITDSSGGTFTSNTSLYVITGNLSVGNTVTAPTVNTDVIIFDDGTRLTSNVQIVKAYAHANGAFDAANTITSNLANVLVTNVVVANTSVTTNNLVANTSIRTNTLIANTSITTNDVVANVSITTNTFLANTITANTLTVNTSITTNTITANTLTINNSITTNTLTANLVTAVDVNTTSDITLKDNIVKISNSLEILEQITGFSFNWKSDGIKSYGVSAQEVESVLPELVRTRQDGFKGVNYLNLIAFLIEAIKDLKKDVNEIKKNINNS